MLLGDIVALDEDAGRGAVARHDWLVDEIEIALGEDAIRAVLQIDERAAPDMGLPGSINPIEQSDEALLDHFRKGFRNCPSDDIAAVNQRPVGLIHHGEAMLRSAQHRNESGRLLEHELQALAFGLELPLDPHLVRDFDDDGYDAGRPAVFAQERGIVEVEPDLLRFAAMPVKRKGEISIGERLAGEPQLHDVVVEVGDLRPTLPDLGAEQIWVAATGERGIAVVVDHDPVLAPQGHDRDRRAQDERDRAFKACRPALYRTKRRRSPVETGDDLGRFPSTTQKRVASGGNTVQADPPTSCDWTGHIGEVTRRTDTRTQSLIVSGQFQ